MAQLVLNMNIWSAMEIAKYSENIDIFKKRTENTKHQHLTIYSNHTMY
jgi:hypothetical protein